MRPKAWSSKNERTKVSKAFHKKYHLKNPSSPNSHYTHPKTQKVIYKRGKQSANKAH
jgi:hypothetical protein